MYLILCVSSAVERCFHQCVFREFAAPYTINIHVFLTSCYMFPNTEAAILCCICLFRFGSHFNWFRFDPVRSLPFSNTDEPNGSKFGWTIGQKWTFSYDIVLQFLYIVDNENSICRCTCSYVIKHLLAYAFCLDNNGKKSEFWKAT